MNMDRRTLNVGRTVVGTRTNRIILRRTHIVAGTYPCHRAVVKAGMAVSGGGTIDRATIMVTIVAGAIDRADIMIAIVAGTIDRAAIMVAIVAGAIDRAAIMIAVGTGTNRARVVVAVIAGAAACA